MSDPLENLVPGPKGDRAAGREMLIGEIEAALLPDYADDELVKKELGKAFDFVVTEAARAALVRKKAAAVYEVMFSEIFRELAGGGEVSINGFARFYVEPARDTVEVAFVSGFPDPILPSDSVVFEYRTAEEEDGNWTGENKARYVLGGAFARGSELDDGFVGGTYYRNSVYNMGFGGGSAYGVTEKNFLRVTAVGADGLEREYIVGGLSIQVRGHDERVYDESGSGDYRIEFVTEEEPGRVVDLNVTAESGMRIGGGYLPIRAGEYRYLIESGIDGMSQTAISFESFYGYPAAVLLQLFPRRRRVVRRWGQTFETTVISRNEFFQRFGHREQELRALGAWPERTRNFGASVACDFRPDFIAALQDGAESQG